MNIGQMKNMIVLKDIPSNIVDEAIVILKSNISIKKKEVAENKNSNDYIENSNGNYELVIKEAESVIKDYVKNIEYSKETKSNINKIRIKYKKLKICSLMLAVTLIFGIIISILT